MKKAVSTRRSDRDDHASIRVENEWKGMMRPRKKKRKG